MAASDNKSERIDVRTTAATKAKLRRAATQARKTVSEFLLDAGTIAAAETLADRRTFALDEKQWRAFLTALDRPVRHKPRLARLLSKPGALE